MLSTPWSRGFGLRVPILNAPMGGVAGGRLAAAVTAAGGLGMVGMGSDGTRESLQTQLQHVRGKFGIGLVDWVMRNEAGLLEDALAARPALLSVSFGTEWSWVGEGARRRNRNRHTGIRRSRRSPGGRRRRRPPGRAGVRGWRARRDRSSRRCRCSTPCWMPWTVLRCPFSRVAASPRREAWPPCWPPVRAERGWAPAWRRARRRSPATAAAGR